MYSEFPLAKKPPSLFMLRYFEKEMSKEGKSHFSYTVKNGEKQSNVHAFDVLPHYIRKSLHFMNAFRTEISIKMILDVKIK